MLKYYAQFLKINKPYPCIKGIIFRLYDSSANEARYFSASHIQTLGSLLYCHPFFTHVSLNPLVVWAIFLILPDITVYVQDMYRICQDIYGIVRVKFGCGHNLLLA